MSNRFIRDVAEIFGRRLAHFVESHIVPDVWGGNSASIKVILLVESPHKAEVDSGHPLAERSGKSVTRALKDNIPAMCSVSRDIAIGNLVADGDQNVSWLGIMNTSRLPLQVGAYRANGADCSSNIPAWSKFAKCLRYVRGECRPVTERNEAALLLERAIVRDLQERLHKIPIGNDHLLMCCGTLAQRIFERAAVHSAFRVAYAPHPSYGQWQKKKYANEMQDVYDSIVHAYELA